MILAAGAKVTTKDEAGGDYPLRTAIGKLPKQLGGRTSLARAKSRHGSPL